MSGDRLGRARAKVIGQYHDSLRRRVRELEELRGDLVDNAAAAAVLRSHAHQLRGSGTSYGYPEITEAAGALEDEPDEALPAGLTNLLGVLAGVLDPPTVGTILVVDDDTDWLQLATRALELRGWVVATAATLEVARSHVENQGPEIVILDLLLPDGDGRELLAAVHGEPTGSGPEFIVVTGNASSSAQAECLLLGASMVFDKRQEMEILVAAATAKLEQRRRLHRTVRVDPLTSLANRAGFQEAFDRAVAVSRRQLGSLSVGMIDIDHFKSVNDRYGHLAGDEALAHFARVATDELRQGELVARWGGEEFVVLFPATAAGPAAAALGRVADRLRAEPVVTGAGDRIVLTFSAGVVEVADGTLDDVLSIADRRLLAAKGLGRDRVLDDDPVEDWQPAVLVVDDDDDLVSYVTSLLASSGFQVERARSGSSALEALSAGIPALVLLDVGLPDVSGFDLLRELRSGGIDVPVIVLTARGDEDAVETAFGYGADDFIQKPVRDRVLLARIRHVVRSRQGSNR